jgi:hypothetical protein
MAFVSLGPISVNASATMARLTSISSKVNPFIDFISTSHVNNHDVKKQARG